MSEYDRPTNEALAEWLDGVLMPSLYDGQMARTAAARLRAWPVCGPCGEQASAEVERLNALLAQAEGVARERERDWALAEGRCNTMRADIEQVRDLLRGAWNREPASVREACERAYHWLRASVESDHA